jgi:putative transposase
MAVISEASERRVCRVLEVSRSAVRGEEPEGAAPARGVMLDQELAEAIHHLIIEHPTFGYRRIWALLRFGQGREVNRKKVYRVMRLSGWMTHQRRTTPRPRVRGSRSVAASSNSRWAMDLTHIYCGEDGWGHLVAVIDCHDREVVGWEFALRGRTKEAERALEEACINRFGTLRVAGEGPVIRSDNGLVFLSKRFRQACRFYRLTQEFVTPYTPEQNGVVERFFRSLKEECVWQHLFRSYEEARSAISRWIRWYNQERPHQALGYLSPAQFRAQQLTLVA